MPEIEYASKLRNFKDRRDFIPRRIIQSRAETPIPEDNISSVSEISFDFQ